MSLSGSASESYNKTGDGMLRVNEAQGPEPTPENPAGVFPQSAGPSAEPGTMPGSGAPERHGDVRGVFGNIEMFKETFSDLSSAFTTAMNSIKAEGDSGLGTSAKALLKRLEGMRDEVDGWRSGKGLPEVEAAGGERNDDVDRPQGGEGAGGLYAD